jgi:Ca2+-binding RTX toxin-like protein
MGVMRKVSFAGIIGLALILAPQAIASTVTVSGGNTIKVAESGNEINRVAVSYVAATNVYSVADTAANLTPNGTCTAVNAHTASCPGMGIKTISVDTGGRDDSIALDTSIPSTAAGDLDGGPGNDTLIGSPSADKLRGGSGKDSLDGRDGADDIGGGSGTDALVYPATRQNPVIVTIGSGSGNDGGPEDQTGSRRDTVQGDIEVLFGTNGNDVLVGDRSAETLFGLTGDDVLFGNGGNDTLLGFDGADLFVGGPGNDTARGGFGDDRLFGKAGGDRLAGGPDNDFLRGGSGADVMKGKTGIDRINAHDGERDIKINCGPGSKGAESAKRDRHLDPRPRSC